MFRRPETFCLAAVILLYPRGAADSVNKLLTVLLCIHGALDPILNSF